MHIHAYTYTYTYIHIHIHIHIHKYTYIYIYMYVKPVYDADIMEISWTLYWIDRDKSYHTAVIFRAHDVWMPMAWDECGMKLSLGAS